MISGFKALVVLAAALAATNGAAANPLASKSTSTCKTNTITLTRPVDASGTPIGDAPVEWVTVTPTAYYPGCSVVHTVTQDITVTGRPGKPTSVPPKTKTCQTNTITYTRPVDGSGNPIGGGPTSTSEYTTVTPTAWYPSCSVVSTITQDLTVTSKPTGHIKPPKTKTCQTNTITYTRPVDGSGSPIGGAPTTSEYTTVTPTAWYPGCSVVSTVTQDLTVTKPQQTKTCQTNTITRTLPVDASGSPVVTDPAQTSEYVTATPTAWYPGCSVVVTVTKGVPIAKPTRGA